MQGSEASETKHVKDVRGTNARKGKLESIDGQLDKYKSQSGNFNRVWTEWKAIFEAAKDSIMVIDSHSRITHANRATSYFLGKPLEEIIGKTCWQTVHGMNEPPKECPLKRALSSGEHEEAELYVQEKSIWIEVTADPIIGDEDQTKRAIHIIRDITGRRKVEEALHESEEKYRSIFESIVDVYYRADLEGNILLFSPSGLRLLGYDSINDLEGKNLVKDFYYHQEEREIFLNKLKQHGRVVNYKVTLRRRDGTSVFGEINSHLVYDRTGRPVAVEGIFRDISDRRRAEETLRESEKNFRGIFENSLIGMYRTTPEGRILMANPALVQMLGYTSFKELATRNLEQHGFESDYPRSLFKQRIEAEGRVIGLESAWYRRDGTTLFVRESAQTICDDAGNVLYYQGTVEDITEHKKAEEALRSSENRLSLAMECTGLGLWDQDFRTSQVTRNDNWVTMLGYTPSEIPLDSKAFYKLIHPDDRSRFEKCARDHEAGRTSVFDVEIRMRTRSDQWCWVRNFGRVIKRDENNKPLRAVGVHLDITERKKAEEAIKASEFRYRELFNHMNSGVAVFASSDDGEDFIFTDFNKAGEQIDNIKKENLIGKNVIDVFPGVKEFGLFDVFQNVWKTGVPQLHPVSLYKDDRLVGWRENYVYKLPSGEIVTVYKDLTDRMKAEKALRESEAQLKRAQEVAHVGSWHLDLRTDRLTWSDETYRIFGVPVGQPLKEANFQALVYPDDLSYVKQSWAAALEGGSYDIEHRIAVAGGTRWVHEKAVLEFDAEGQPLSGIGTVQDITERKWAAEAYRSLVDHSLQGLVIFLEGRVVFANEAMAKITGYTVDEMLTMSTDDVRAFVHPDDREMVWDRHRKRLHCELPPERYELRGIRKDGSVRWLEIDACLVEYQGKPVIQAAYVDITDRRKAEEALCESEACFRGIFEDSLVGIYRTTPDGRILMANPTLVRMLGYTSFRKLATRNLEQYKLEPDYLRSQFKRQIEIEGQVVGLESAWRKSDGTTLFVRESARAIRDDAGNILYYQGTVEDITERKRAEEALRESEQKYRELFENAREAIVILDVDKRITDANKFVEGYGFSKEDLIGRNHLDFVVEKYKEKAIEDFEKLCRGIPQEGEYEVITPKGIVTVYYRDNPIIRAGKVIGAQAVLMDITERKRAEEELRKYQVKLKAMASEILKTQERERQRLAIGLHDDVCQSLVLTKLTLESSLRSISEAELATSLKSVAETIGETIRQTESLTFELSNPILCEFGFVAALKKYLSTEIYGKHGIAFDLEADDLLDSLEDDVKTCLFRVTRELLTNVVKHAQARKVKVSVCKNHDKIYVIIQDDGIGFESDEIKDTTSRAIRFGLFSVREQLDYLGGHLIIESKPGRGTVATVVV